MDEMILHAMKQGTKKRSVPKPLKEFHAKEQSDGKYHVVRHSGKPSEPAQESTAENMNQVQQALEEHMGTPNDGEDEVASMGAGQPGMGGTAA